jgi:hypothetical protein
MSVVFVASDPRLWTAWEIVPDTAIESKLQVGYDFGLVSSKRKGHSKNNGEIEYEKYYVPTSK